MAILALTFSFIFSGCGGSTTDSDTGTLLLKLTDAPTDHEDITGVYVTFTGLSYQYADTNDSWQDVDLNTSRTIDLLTLQDGNTTLLQQVELPAGEITHVRFMLDTSECYVELLDSQRVDMKVPSGDQTGYKAIGGFTIPAGGIVNVTADFDVRKSIAATGNGKFNLNPTIKIFDNIEVGEINGTMSLDINGSQAILYAFNGGTWVKPETNTTDSDFLNAVLSTNATDGDFTLPWLTTGVYDLVLVSYTNTGEFETILGYISDVNVQAGTTTTVDISNATLLDALP